MIRFTIEANSTETASPADPLNQKSAESIVRRPSAAGASFDPTLYEYLKKELFFNDSAASRLREEHPDHVAPQSYFAFDFERNGQILGKGFFFFFWKRKVTGQSPRHIAQKLITCAPVIGPSFTTALSSWEQCQTSFPSEFGGEPRMECIGFDLLQPGQSSKIKVYCAS